MEIVQPAQLSFLAIYNPSLGRTDETLHDQVVYYYSAQSAKAQRPSGRTAEETEHADRQDRNERLRQIGLAQGMVEFAKAFSEGVPVDAIDADKTRIVLHELEPGWWMLASVDLTRLRHTTSHSRSKSESPGEYVEEFSGREVAPQELLLQQLLRAHAIFLMHQAPSLADLYVRLSREKFCNVLGIYWNRFVQVWDVLLHGNPSVDIFNGIKLSAGGELGIGVGEEEWGSGEREVLEGFIGRTEGLLDVVVSRFGDADEKSAPPKGPWDRQRTRWLGTGALPSSSDGVVFSGIGTLTRPSLRAVSAWMENIYSYGAMAYGVLDNPQSTRKRRKRKQESLSFRPGAPVSQMSPKQERGRQSTVPDTQPASPESAAPGIPPPIVRAADESLEAATVEATQSASQKVGERSASPSTTDTFVKYATLGIYGSSWGIPSGRPQSHGRQASTHEEEKGTSEPVTPSKPMRHMVPKSIDNDPSAEFDVEHGCFLVGLRGSLEDTQATEFEDPGVTSDDVELPKDAMNWDRRVVLRTLQIERHRIPSKDPGIPGATEAPASTLFDRHRVVVYAYRPFIFLFLFSAQTPTLSYASLYRSLHHQLGPLQRSLLRSTSPAHAHARARAALHSPRTVAQADAATVDAPIYDLLYDPKALTVIASLPGIPEPATAAAEGLWRASRGASPGRDPNSTSEDWTRLDALSVHAHVLQTVSVTRQRPGDRERLQKTSRGWWVVWLRLPAEEKEGEDTETKPQDEGAEEKHREAFLVRQASDHVPAGSAKKGSGLGFGTGGSVTGSPARGSGRESMGRIVEGIGVDARRYVEGLLHLTR